MPTLPTPENEMDRLLSLAEFDLDYADHQSNFKDLTRLAAKVAGTEISLINLIDSYTQWTVSSHGLELSQMPREDSVCQYTIINTDHFEVEDLSGDVRFKNKFYVVDDPNLRYYYGVPLKFDDTHNIGALCVLDKNVNHLSPEKAELLKIIADEIVSRFKQFKAVERLKQELSAAKEMQMKVVHDIRGPLSGIIGLAQLITDQGEENQIDEVLDLIGLINKSSRSILDLADEILNAEKKLAANDTQTGEFNMLVFKEKLERLYTPQALNKNITFTVNTHPDSEKIPFSKNKVLQIAGNLISNAIKFTPNGGTVEADLSLLVEENNNTTLQILIKDTGVGLSAQGIEKILNGDSISTSGTKGEAGYGFGLALVRHLINTLQGSLNIHSKLGEGTVFEVKLPQH